MAPTRARATLTRPQQQHQPPPAHAERYLSMPSQGEQLPTRHCPLLDDRGKSPHRFGGVTFHDHRRSTRLSRTRPDRPSTVDGRTGHLHSPTPRPAPHHGSADFAPKYADDSVGDTPEITAIDTAR